MEDNMASANTALVAGENKERRETKLESEVERAMKQKNLILEDDAVNG
jgi:hypothetical protein